MPYTKQEALEASLTYFEGDELAAKAFVDKYALHENDMYFERTPNEMHWRLANEFARIERNYPNPLSGVDIFQALKGFKKIVPGGSPMSGIGNRHAVISLSNCVAVESPDDTLSSIYSKGRDLANLFKRRCGAGIDITTLRPDGSPVSNSAKTSTGAWSFADLYSYIAKHTAQQGRRGALMITLDVSHPDIYKFVTMKADMKCVTGANISVMITDAFMKAVKADDWWFLQFRPSAIEETMRPDGTLKFPISKVKARELWNLICKTATETAEPGIIFIDNYRRNLPLDYYPEFKSVCVNPCSEILLSAYDSCRLLSQNLRGFVINPFTPEANIDIVDFKKHVHIAMRLLDDLVDLEIECLQNIVKRADTEDERILFGKMENAAQRGRRTGLGTHGLADTLAALNLRYDDSGTARDVIRELYAMSRNEAYRASIQLAVERGAFPAFDWEVEKDCPFITQLPEDIYDMMKHCGRRNGALLTNAPTGTVSIMSQTSSGIEPVFDNYYMRRRKVAESDGYDFRGEDGEYYQNYQVANHNLQQYFDITGKTEIPDFFVTANDIDWHERVKIQGIIQEYIDHGISSTINLPRGTEVGIVQQLYEEAHECGLKGLTVYVDGSRDGILVRNPVKEEDWSIRPEVLPCEIFHANVQRGGETEQFIILVTTRDSLPYEVFGGKAEFLDLPKSYQYGKMTKIASKPKNRYELEAINGGEPVIVRDIGIAFRNNEYSVVSRLATMALRSRTSVIKVVDQLLKEPDSNLFTYTKVIARVLKKYITEGERSSLRCPECDSKDSLRFQEGCFVCTNCGFTGCS